MNNSLDARMKTYEYVTRTYLTRRMPVIIRIDGKAFHSFTKGFQKPFDEIIVKTMQDTMKYLCQNIDGCVLGYTQSDEISLVLCDYKKLSSQAWFNNNIQKICSISASMATMAFNTFYKNNVNYWNDNCLHEHESQYSKYIKSFDKAMFDSRAFNIPKEEVNNYLLWRQQDATRNSIQSLAQSCFSHKQLEGKNNNELQEMLWQEKKINWNNLPIHLKRGSCCRKDTYIDKDGDKKEDAVYRSWLIDKEIPIFSQDTDYVNSRIIFE